MTSETLDIFWITFAAMLVFIMQPGFVCLETGLTRAKNSINVAAKNFTDFVVAVLMYWAVGYALMHGVSIAGWFGGSRFFLDGNHTPFLLSFFLFQAMFCATATTIISGAVAERMRFRAYVLITILISAAVYPVFGHWVWNRSEFGTLAGWLGARNFIDFAGSTVVHSLGGWVALAAVLVIGPRKGRFPSNGPPRIIHGSNLPMAVLGALLLWIGWFGFNGGSTLALNEEVAGIFINTLLGGTAGAVMTLIVSWLWHGVPRVPLLINGSLAGLVAITASTPFISPGSAFVIGGLGGLVMLASAHLLERFRVDDAVGAIPVHLGAGVWGTIAVALFADAERLGTGLVWWQQLIVQLQGIVACFGIAFCLVYLVLKIIDRIWPLRVSDESEELGLNVSEHGASTDYLEFLRAIEEQARTQNLDLRAPEEPFTEVGQIARRYNKMLDALKEAVSKTEAIVNTANDAIITFAREEFTVSSLNPAACTIFGYDANELIGRPLEAFLEREDGGEGASNRSFLQSLLPAFGEVGKFEATGRRADGSTFPIEMTLVEAEAKSTKFYVGNLRDISERRQNEETQRQFNKQLERLVADRTQDLRQEVAERRRAEESLQQSQTELIRAQEIAMVGSWTWPLDEGGKINVSDEYLRIIGFATNQPPKNQAEFNRYIHPDDLERCVKIFDEVVDAPSDYEIEYRFVRPDGEICHIVEIGELFFDDSGRAIGHTGTIQDMTELKRAEEQLRHAQKMEAVGQLTAGVAHDFNNMLAVTLGNAELLEFELGADNPRLAAVVHATKRAADLTQRLLAFSRKQVLNPETINVNNLIADITGLLRRTLEEHIDIETTTTAGLWNCEIDPAQLENALLNLAINARDAMPDGGKLVVNATNVRLTGDQVDTWDNVRSGEYVLITISDTGSGMPEKVKDMIFEPFFTTKDIGKGSGLGLSMVHGFVMQSRGHITVESEEGAGTTFKLYLPRSEASEVEAKTRIAGEVPRAKPGETVLVAEDDADLRSLVVMMLDRLGYTVHEAGDGHVALGILAEVKHVDLILSDMVLPGGMNGPALAIAARRKCSGLKVLYMTGYAADTTLQQARGDSGAAILRKPFTMEDLARNVWLLLHG